MGYFLYNFGAMAFRKYRNCMVKPASISFSEDPQKLAEALRKAQRPHPRYWPHVGIQRLKIPIKPLLTCIYACRNCFERNVNHLFISSFKINKFYYCHMLRGSSRGSHGSDFAKMSLVAATGGYAEGFAEVRFCVQQRKPGIFDTTQCHSASERCLMTFSRRFLKFLFYFLRLHERSRFFQFSIFSFTCCTVSAIFY